MRLSSLVTAASLTLGALVPLSAAAPSPVRASAPDDPVVVSGTWAGAETIESVRFLIYPRDSALLELEVGEVSDPTFEVPSHDVIVDGTHFQASLDPTVIPRDYIGRDGVVRVEAVFDTSDGVFTSTTSARAVLEPATRELLWAEPSDSGTLAVGNSRAKIGGGSYPRVLDATSARAEWEDDGVDIGAPTYRTAGDPSPPAGCSYRKLDTSIRQVTIGTTYPSGADTASMVVHSSTGADYGVATSFKGPQGWGGFTSTGTKYTSRGWGFEWAPSSRARSYRLRVQYGLFLLDCVRGCDACQRQWFPIGETGGTGSNYDIVRPDWSKCEPIGRGRWWRDKSSGQAYTYGAAVKFAVLIGIDLSVSRQYNSSQKLYYDLTRKRLLCGNNDYPAYAGKVMSRLLR